MAHARQTVSDTETEEIGVESDDIGELSNVLDTLAAEGDKEIAIRLYRLKAGKRAFLFRCLPSDMETLHESLRDDYMGGDFEAFVYQGGKLVKRKLLCIEPPPKQKEVPQNSGSMEIQAVMQGLNTLGSAVAKLGELIVESRQVPVPTPQLSQYEMMQQNLSMMLQMKQLFDTNTPRVDPTENFLKGIEFAKEIAGEALGEKSDPTPGAVLMTLADKLAPTLTELFKAQQMGAANRPVAKPRPANLPKPAPSPVTESSPQPEKAPSMIAVMLRPHINTLIQYAEAGVLPADVALSILEAVPEIYFDKFGDFIFSDTCVDEMIAANPKATVHREWFAALRLEMQKLLTDDTEETSLQENMQPGLDHEQNNGNLDGDPIGGSGNENNA